MRELLPVIAGWRGEGKGVALAVVVGVRGSAPRPAGSRMAVSSAGEIAGSVSGGCVESAVVEVAGEVLAAGRGRLVRFGVSDEDAWAVGLSCGGEIEVLVAPAALPEELARRLEADRPAALATVLRGPEPGRCLALLEGGERRGGLGSPALDDGAAARMGTFLDGAPASPEPWRESFGDAGDEPVEVFFEVFAPRPQVVIVGAVHTAVALVTLARVLGLRTVVIDPRTAFANRERFPHADELLVEWPREALARLDLHQGTAVVVLSHDMKIDLPALEVALASRAGYIGALGSRETHRRREAALREAGVEEAALARVRSPIGLDLGGRRPEELAVAILAEILAARHGKDPRAPREQGLTEAAVRRTLGEE